MAFTCSRHAPVASSARLARAAAQASLQRLESAVAEAFAEDPPGLVQQVDVRRAAVHVEKDDARRLGLVMRLARSQGIAAANGSSIASIPS